MSSSLPNECRDAVHGVRLADDHQAVLESPRHTPVVEKVDILVVGGGPAGVGAALAGAREGAKTILIERHGMLGGMWTAGLVNPVFDFRRKGWIVKELIERLETGGAWRPDPRRPTFDVEAMVHLLEQMMAEAGARFWYHSLAVEPVVENGRVHGAIIESKAGREAVLAEVVIDCSGDGDMAARAGAPYELGRPADGLMQPMTLMFEIDGTGEFEQSKTPDTYGQMLDAIRKYDLGIDLPFGRVNYTPAIIRMPRSGSAVVQATHVYRLNGIDPRDVTRGIVDARRQAHNLTTVLKHLPGLEKCRLLHTAPTLGIRETRRISGRYRLDIEDLARGCRFEDAVTFCAFGVDIHEPAPGAGVPSGHGARIKPYEIPFRCLLPRDVDNLLVAGRCISGSHEAHASYRVTGTCMGMGQAAGLAAAQAVARECSPTQLDGTDLRRALADRGVGLL